MAGRIRFYGHVEALAAAVARGARSVPGSVVDLKRVPKTMPSDVFRGAGAVLSPGDIAARPTWRDNSAASSFLSAGVPEGVRCRMVRVIRDYGMYDRREAPQYYPERAAAS